METRLILLYFGISIVSVYFGIWIAGLRKLECSLKDKITAFLIAVGVSAAFYLVALFILKTAASLWPEM